MVIISRASVAVTLTKRRETKR